MALLYFNETDVRMLYRYLGFNQNRVAEVRCIKVQNGGGVHARAFIQSENAFVQWAKENNGKGNCFVGRNPRDGDGQIRLCSCISLDLDPANYDKSVGATAEETGRCISSLGKLGVRYGNGTQCSTGNGSLILWRIEDTEPSEALLGQLKLLQSEAQKIVGTEVKIDATQDHARLVKLIGTVSVKGSIRPTRFIGLPSIGRKGDWFHVPVSGGNREERRDTKLLLYKSNHPSRSEADFALVVHYKESGLGPLDCLDALKKHVLGRPDRADDHKRLIEKVYKINFTSDGFKQWEVENEPEQIVFHTPQSSITGYLEDCKNRQDGKTSGLKTGFSELDEATGGLQKGELWTVGARPGVGKSSLLRSIALNLCNSSHSVLMLTTEMTAYRVWDCLISNATGIETQKIMQGKLTDEERETIKQFLNNKFNAYSLTVMDSFTPSADMVKRAVDKIQPSVVMFDHIQHIEGGDKYESLSAFIKVLKEIAMQYCPVICASQLKRPMQSFNYQTKAITSAKPTMSDFKGCGRIEEESSVAIALSEGTNNGDVRYITMDVLKNRYGPQLYSELAFYPKTTKFQGIKEL